MAILLGLLNLEYKGTKILQNVGQLYPSTHHHIPEDFGRWYTHTSHQLVTRKITNPGNAA
jgi:hypothetical protein